MKTYINKMPKQSTYAKLYKIFPKVLFNICK